MARSSFVLSVLFAFLLAGCGGGGSTLGKLAGTAAPSGKNRSIAVTFSFPARSTSARIIRKPTTISSTVESVTVTVNGGTPQVFNVTSNSGGCTTNGGTTTCTFTVGAPFGLDTFLILTFDGTNGTGTALNAAVQTMNVSASGPNSFAATAGNVVFVTTNADSGAGSLRAAVTGAAAGVTTAVLFQGVSGTITLSSTIPIAQNVAIIGPGASNLTISGGGSVQMFTVASSMNAVIYGLTLTGGFSSVAGGAVLNNGTLSVFSSTFNGNSASNPSASSFITGGAIQNMGTLIVTGSTFTNNTAVGPPSFGASGGAIYSEGDVNVDSSTFQGNSVTTVAGGSQADGGAITESFFITTGLTVTNSKFFQNTAGGSNTQFASGGAIYDGSGEPNGMTIANNTFGGSGLGNSASASISATGGAVYLFGVSASDGGVGGNAFTSNSTSAPTGAFASGGAFEVDQGDVTLSGPNNTFTGNSATGGSEGAGGAIADFAGGALNIAAGTSFTSNSANGTDSTGSAFGGAIEYFFFPCFGQFQDVVPAGRRIRASGGAAPRPAKALGHRIPAIRSKGSIIRRPMSVSSTTLGGTYQNNSVNAGTSAPGSGSSAGGGALDLEIQTGGPAINLQSVSITSNSVTGSTAAGADGGAVSIFSGTVSVTGSQIGSQSAGNKALTRGGGIVVGFNGPAFNSCGTLYPGALSIANSTVEGNSLSAADQTFYGGGGIANLASTVVLSGDTLAFNTVTSSDSGGGGIFAIAGAANATTTILNSTVYQNTSNNVGGGIMLAGTTGVNNVATTNSTAFQNSAANFGGNIYIFAAGGNNTLTPANSIVAGGTSGNADSADIYNGDSINDLDYNLIGVVPQTSPGSHFCNGVFSASPCAHDIVAVSPGLGSLAANGGPTPTLADGSSSPGTGHIPFSGGLCNGQPGTNVDQRGFARGAGGVCDMGAFEFAGVAP